MLKYYIMSFLLTLIIIFFVQKIAIRLNIVDKPNHRKIHQKPKALLGGVGIYLGMALTYANFLNYNFSKNNIMVLILAGCIVLVGLYDDIKDMKAIYKLMFQVLIAFLTSILLGGIHRLEIYDLVLNFSFPIGIMIQTFWLIALINAFNLIDGLDGLSSGVGAISLVSLLVLSIIKNDITSVTIILIIIGSLLAFLYYNFNPATIFLGDSGSMLIGYVIGLISMDSYKTVTLTTTLLLLLIAFMPFLDVFLAIIRRKANHRRAFEADSLHFHHRLLRKGYTHTQAVLVLYGIMSIYTLTAISLELLNDSFIKIILLFIVFIVTIIVFENLYLLSDKHAYVSKFLKKFKPVKK